MFYGLISGRLRCKDQTSTGLLDQPSVIIHVGGNPDRWQRLCHSVTVAGSFGAPYAMPYENDRPIFICRGLRIPLASLWPRLQRYL